MNTVAQFADAITNGEAPELFADSSQMRDFTHVEDIARACELAADRELTGVYNVGTQESCSFNEMVELINDALGTDVSSWSYFSATRSASARTALRCRSVMMWWG